MPMLEGPPPMALPALGIMVGLTFGTMPMPFGTMLLPGFGIMPAPIMGVGIIPPMLLPGFGIMPPPAALVGMNAAGALLLMSAALGSPATPTTGTKVACSHG